MLNSAQHLLLIKSNHFVREKNGALAEPVVSRKALNRGIPVPRAYPAQNKTSFKKGRPTWNAKPIGYERICSKDGYVLVKTSEPSVFELKHRIVWEKEKGLIPEGYVVAFKNQDKTDCRIENLILMSKAEMVRYSQSYYELATPDSNESCLLMAKIKNMKHQLHKQVK